MTPEEINRAIAEACNFQPTKEPVFPYREQWWKDGRHYCACDLPNFCGDLNAMHSAVTSKPIEFMRRFQTALSYRSSRTGKLFCQLTALDWAEEFLQVERVRPSHIFIGTRSDNMKDCSSKGRLRPENGCRAMLRTRRLRFGSENTQSKLMESDVATIKGIKKAYGMGRVLAVHFGVSEQVISGIWSGRRWPQVEANQNTAEAFLRTLGKWKD